MATLDAIVANGQLVQLGGGLEAHEMPERLLYAYPHVIKWLDETLPELEAELGDGKQDPMEQVDYLFYDFVSGADLSYYERSHSMNPHALGVWELKTPDTRFFGWFVHNGTFIIAEADTAFRCKQHNLYPGYLGQVVRRRDALDLDEPKFVTGDYSNVL